MVKGCVNEYIWIAEYVCLSILTVNVVDLEEELDLVVGALSGELVHGVDELLQADAPVVVLVENVKDALHEERL